MSLSATDLAAKIDELMAKKPFLFELSREPVLSSDELDAIESQTNVRLPAAFREHIMTYGAGDFGFGAVYSPDPQSSLSLWKEYAFAPVLSGKYLPFADNGGGDYQCFPIIKGTCEDKIVWADHEQNYSVTDAECADFRDFIGRVCLTS